MSSFTVAFEGKIDTASLMEFGRTAVCEVSFLLIYTNQENNTVCILESRSRTTAQIAELVRLTLKNTAEIGFRVGIIPDKILIIRVRRHFFFSY